MIEDWLDIEEAQHGEGKRLYVLTEKEGGRAVAQVDLIERVRAHYDDPRRIADDIAELGFPGAAAILRERLPTDARTRSGEVGEILATEFVEHQTGFRFPVRRLRYKDGRDVPMRGDDFLGIQEAEDRLEYLKGEAKSGVNMARGVITEARTRLYADNGRPTPISLIFVSERLIEAGGADEEVGRTIRNAIGQGSIQARHVTHGLFTVTGNDRIADLKDDLEGAEDAYGHMSANLRINDHQAFIAWVYEEAENLGDD